MEKRKKLNIVCLGFDWGRIGKDNYKISKSKLDRDGLDTNFNHFFVFYAGNKNSREQVVGDSIFKVWHINIGIKLRFFYDLAFMFLLPISLIVERFKPDLFYLYDFNHIFAAYLPAKLTGAKVYFRLINLPTELSLTKGFRGKFLYWYYRCLEKITYKAIDKFVVINHTTQKYLNNIGVENSRISFDIPDTISIDKSFIEKADKNLVRKDFNILPDKKILISIGSLIKEKGFEDLINSLAETKRNDIMLVICGQGKDEEKLKKICRDLNLKNVIFAGLVGRDKIWSYLAGSDLFILFSKSESLGMVFWEAMYSGLPVIGTPIGGVAETIGYDGERGFYWKGNVEDLNKKIDFYLAESRGKEVILERAKQYVVESLKQKKTINQIYE